MARIIGVDVRLEPAAMRSGLAALAEYRCLTKEAAQIAMKSLCLPNAEEAGGVELETTRLLKN